MAQTQPSTLGATQFGLGQALGPEIPLPTAPRR